jgi:S-adenosylhomocysteine hydrolase
MFTTEGSVNAELVSTTDALLAGHVLFILEVGLVGRGVSCNDNSSKEDNASNLDHF